MGRMVIIQYLILPSVVVMEGKSLWCRPQRDGGGPGHTGQPATFWLFLPGCRVLDPSPILHQGASTTSLGKDNLGANLDHVAPAEENSPRQRLWDRESSGARADKGGQLELHVEYLPRNITRENQINAKCTKPVSKGISHLGSTPAKIPVPVSVPVLVITRP